jgi:cytochrome P450
MIKPLAGEGLLTSEGEDWRRRRKLAQPAFHRERIAAFATGMTHATIAMLERWEPFVEQKQPQQSQQSIDIVHEMQRLTLGIVSTALFSTDISGDSDEMGGALNDIFAYFNHRSRTPLSLPAGVPTRRNRRFKQAVQRLDAITYRVIEEHRRGETKSDDLLSMLLEARDEETGEGLSNTQLRDEVGTFLAAGHETTAMTLAWTWYMLSKHPAIEHKLHAELAEVLGGRLPTAADIPQLTYTRMIIQEVMRLYPAAWAMTRVIKNNDKINGYPIKAGTIMVLSPYVTHRHPAFWENPEGFDPERFTPERIAERPRYAYFPFGGGPRQCIGNEFALMEAQLIVAMVAQRYRLHLIPGQKVEPDPIFTLRPSTAVHFALHAR